MVDVDGSWLSVSALRCQRGIVLVGRGAIFLANIECSQRQHILRKRRRALTKSSDGTEVDGLDAVKGRRTSVISSAATLAEDAEQVVCGRGEAKS